MQDIELNSDIKMNNNPSYSITKQSTKQEDQYDYVLHNKSILQSDPQDTIKMDPNPSYGRVHSCNAYVVTDHAPEYDVAIHSNPSYSSMSKEPTKMSENVETNSHSTQNADYFEIIGSTTKTRELTCNLTMGNKDDVTINYNPCYDSVSGSVKLEDNPSYNKTILDQHK